MKTRLCLIGSNIWLLNKSQQFSLATLSSLPFSILPLISRQQLAMFEVGLHVPPAQDNHSFKWRKAHLEAQRSPMAYVYAAHEAHLSKVKHDLKMDINFIKYNLKSNLISKKFKISNIFKKH